MSLLAQRQAFSGVRVAQKAPVVAVARGRSAVQVNAFFGSKAAAGGAGGAAAAPTFHICVDCGYIYDGGAEWKTVPSSYKCPVCSSPKSRFKVYKGTDVKGRPSNAPAVMKKRKDAKQW